MLSPAKRHRTPKHDLSEFQFRQLLETASRLAIVMIGAFALIVAMQAAQVILAPVSLAIILGLVFGPVADKLEDRGIPPALSAGLVVVMLILVIAASVALFAVPVSEWIARAPSLWAKVQGELRNLQGPLQSLSAVQDQIDAALGNSSNALEVTVSEGNQVLDLALLAPQILGDVLIFLVSLYFYLATRESIRLSILSLIVTRRMRWRTAHIFSDVEGKVSRFLLSVTMLNAFVGVAMTVVAFALGLPSPLLIGACAFILNYIPYVGQAVMILILLAVGLSTEADLTGILLPVGAYLGINLIEGQLVFPHFVGHQMTINPFLIFLSIVFWIWVWGPFGSLMAVPSLLILQSTISNILPTKEVKPKRPVRRTPNMTEKDVVLANAAIAIKEQAEEEAAAEAAAEEAKREAEEAKHRSPEEEREAQQAKEAAEAHKEKVEAKAAPVDTPRTPRPKTPFGGAAPA